MIRTIPRKGDWISYRRNGQVVIGEVTHVQTGSRSQDTVCWIGEYAVIMDGIIEMRRESAE